MADPVDNVPVGIGAPRKIDAPIRSDRLPKARTEVDTSNSGHHQGSRQYVGQTPVRLSTLTRTVARAGQPHFNTGTMTGESKRTSMGSSVSRRRSARVRALGSVENRDPLTRGPYRDYRAKCASRTAAEMFASMGGCSTGRTPASRWRPRPWTARQRLRSRPAPVVRPAEARRLLCHEGVIHLTQVVQVSGDGGVRWQSRRPPATAGLNLRGPSSSAPALEKWVPTTPEASATREGRRCVT